MKLILIGIKGTGMCSLAKILLDDGYEIIGYDYEDYFFTDDLLKQYKIDVFNFDDFEFNINNIYIIGNNYIDNPRFQNIINKENVFKYMDFLSSYINKRYSVAICGTHGKTTTVGYFYQAYKDVLDLSMYRGDGVGVGGNKESIVFEACEYKDNFLQFKPSEIIVTNIDYDHVDFFKTKKQYNESFITFCSKGNKVYIPYKERNKIESTLCITYGINKKATYSFSKIKVIGSRIKAKVFHYKTHIGVLDLPFKGHFNFMHALSVLAFGMEHNVDFSYICSKLEEFSGVNRRINTKILNGDTYIDDYAHHPNEIKATLKYIKKMYPSQRLVVFFKPDRQSRLLYYYKQFKRVLNSADEVYILPLYERVNGNKEEKLLLRNSKFHYVDNINKTDNIIFNNIKQVFVFMSSKNMNDIIDKVVSMRK